MITKRILGFMAIGVGILIIVGAVAVDMVQAGQWSGFGPLQQAGLAAGIIAMLIGASLIPLGDRPA
jgi:hypothetical protein